jgi:transcriptional regulator with XRE-family HTH domain
MTRNLDATRSPMAFFGAELRRARVSAGMSQDQLGRALSFSGDLVGKIETCERAPSVEFAAGCDEVFVHLDGLFTRLVGLARRWDGPHPQWFRDWVQAEREATSLRWWEPMLVPGLLQTADYARVLFRAWQSGSTSDEEIEESVGARLERQCVLDQARPPELWVLIDEAVLHRQVGSDKIMHDQLLHLADASCRPSITVQVVPAEVGTHAGLLGAFIIASLDGADIAYMETAVEGYTIERSALVSKAALAFDRLRAEALPHRASRDLIGKVAEERWTP